MAAVKRYVPVVLTVSTAIELMVSVRPRWGELHGIARWLADLATQSALLYVLPAALVTVTGQVRLADLGVTLGRPRQWLRWWVPAVAASLPLALLITRLPSVHATYPQLSETRSHPAWLIVSTLVFGIYGFSWEFFFRGFVLFGLEEGLGAAAILVQAVPCALMHWHKPLFELVAALPAAIVLGAMAISARSIVPGFLLHAWVALVVNLGCLFWPL